MKIKIIKIVLFTLIFIIMLSCITKILQPKDDGAIYGVRTFFAQNNNHNSDILFIGSSHIHCSINPAILYKEYGISSFNLSSGSASFWSIYFYIKESMKYIKPRLIVVDMYTINQGAPYPPDFIFKRFAISMPLSLNKINAIRMEASKNVFHYYINPLVFYHERYSELNFIDFLLYKGRKNRYKYYKHYIPSVKVHLQNEPNIKSIYDVSKLYYKVEEYYLRIIKISKINDIPILFIVAPYVLSNEEQRRFNEAERIANEYNVPFINFNLNYGDYNLDFSKDFRDAGHLNDEGAAKFTRYLGKYLKENYDLPDRRGDPKYYSWEMNAKYHDKDIYNIELKQYTNLNEYMEKVKNADDYVIGITMLGNYQKNDRVLQSIATNFNIDNIYLKNASYVVDNNKLIYSSDGSNQYLFHKEIGSYTDLVIQNGQRLSINRRNYIKTKNGINIVIYDKFTEEIVDNIYLQKY
ncbi:SGNH/GDSL hydrolase family protein [Brachyspira innocens]|uniref:SGNH/GDSL hydrolase family protein n=1 Tax=Brachyspira innocens TaxID=13264 RepID=UPI0026EFF4C5|nr:SGNH/GDSL hydrolase family protein [Brachyspira innocens]